VNDVQYLFDAFRHDRILVAGTGTGGGAGRVWSRGRLPCRRSVDGDPDVQLLYFNRHVDLVE
jgi:hypothetical protein